MNYIQHISYALEVEPDIQETHRRTNMLRASLSVQWLQRGSVHIPTTCNRVEVPITTANVIDQLVRVQGWASATPEGAAGILSGDTWVV